MTETCVHDGWTQFWAKPLPEGRWQIMYAVRSGVRYMEMAADESDSEADALELLRRMRGTRGSC